MPQRTRVYEHSAVHIGQREALSLPPYGPRLRWTCTVTFKEQPLGSGNKMQPPYFVWNQGTAQLQLAVLPQLLEKVPAPPKFAGYDSSSVIQDATDYSDPMLDSLAKLAYTERWRVQVPVLSYRWSSPLLQSYTSRSSAIQAAKELWQRNSTIERVLTGVGKGGRLCHTVCSQKMAFQVGKWRFQRDGVWIVGQEEIWGRERYGSEGVDAVAAVEQQAQHQSPQRRPWTGLSYFLHCERKRHQALRLKELREKAQSCAIVPQMPTTPITGAAVTIPSVVTPEPEASLTTTAPTPSRSTVSFTLRDAEQALRHVWKTKMTAEQQALWVERARVAAGSASQSTEIFPTPTTDSLASPSTPTETVHIATSTGHVATPITDSVLGRSNVVSSEEETSSDSSSSIATAPSQQAPPPAAHKRLAEFYRSRKWCLNADQIQACYSAGMEHYGTCHM